MGIAGIPGLDSEGRWDLSGRLNMAAQCLAGPRDQVAIIDLTGVREVVTYGDLAARAAGVVRDLAARGVGRGDRVGVLLSQDPWCAAAHLGIWTLGAISVPLFKLFQQGALASLISDSRLEFVLIDAEGARLLGDLAVPVLAAEISVSGEAFEMAETGPEDRVVLIYTSGPKGALHGHRVLTGICWVCRSAITICARAIVFGHQRIGPGLGGFLTC